MCCRGDPWQLQSLLGYRYVNANVLYVCMCVQVLVCACMRACARLFVHACVRMSLSLYGHVFACESVHMCAPVNICLHLSLRASMRLHLCEHVHTPGAVMQLILFFACPSSKLRSYLTKLVIDGSNKSDQLKW